MSQLIKNGEIMLFEKIDTNFSGHLSKQEMQKVELRILKQVIQFCEENNIKYFLYYGTLLGAIREKGFIPWDDDVDIAMPREDYNRFLKTYKDDERYKLSYLGIEKDYYLPFAKVYDSYTYLNERVTQNIPMGVYIDIFPIDVYDKNKTTFYINKIKRGLIHCKISLIKQDNTRLMKLLILLGRAVSFWYPLRKSIHSMENNLKISPISEAKQVGVLTEGLLNTKPFPSSYIKETIDWPFEDITVKVPARYDELLTHLYGDYMTPPPSKKRKTAHEKFFSGYRNEFINYFK
jgi:lipopolysaccharide cholinephosphotransferase